MKAEINFLQGKFNEFNTLIFGGALPTIPIELTESKSFLAICVFKRKRKLGGGYTYSNFRLRFNIRLDLPQNVLEDTLIHEMIHYYIGLNHIADTSSHGRVFRDIMTRINTTFGREITIRQRSTPEQHEQFIDKKPRWHVVAVLKFRDGQMAVKVLPRVIERIVAFYNGFIADARVKTIDLYLCCNPYFNRYPCSSALKAAFADAEVINTHLKGAHTLKCDGKTIRQC